MQRIRMPQKLDTKENKQKQTYEWDYWNRNRFLKKSNDSTLVVNMIFFFFVKKALLLKSVSVDIASIMGSSSDLSSLLFGSAKIVTKIKNISIFMIKKCWHYLQKLWQKILMQLWNIKIILNDKKNTENMNGLNDFNFRACTHFLVFFLVFFKQK